METVIMEKARTGDPMDDPLRVFRSKQPPNTFTEYEVLLEGGSSVKYTEKRFFPMLVRNVLRRSAAEPLVVVVNYKQFKVASDSE